MTRYANNLVAAVAAVLIVTVTWVPVVTVPPAQASTLVTQVLA